MGKIIRYYISNEVSKTVAKSQMFNWSKILKKNNINTTFVIFSTKKNKKRLVDMLENINEKIIIVNLIPIIGIREILQLITFIKIWINNIFSSERIIFQSRTSSISFAFAIIKHFPKIKIVYDIRGAGEETIDKELLKKNLLLNMKNYYRKLSEINMLKSADVIFFVSNNMKNFFLSKHKFLKNKMNFVIPGTADQELFFYDLEIRESFRKKYNIDNKIVFLYSGMLNKPWQIPETIFLLYNYLYLKIPSLVLFLLTPNEDIANNLKAKFHFSDKQIIIKEASGKELNNFLNLADYGLLLRENKPINNVASPTKYAEYILSGLPVIISKGIGDYSILTSEKNIGFVIDNIEDITNQDSTLFDNIAEFILNSKKDNLKLRNKISAIGKNSLSKQLYITKIKDIYENL